MKGVLARMALALALSATRASAATRDGEVSVALTGPAAAVAPGEPFALQVTWSWDAALVPAPFDDAALRREGLSVERIETTRHTLEGRIEERRVYRAVAWSRAQVALDSVAVRATTPDGRSEFAANAPPLVVAVAPRLARDDDSPLEWPAELGELPAASRAQSAVRSTVLIAAALAALLLVGAIARRALSVRERAARLASARARLAELATSIAAEPDDPRAAAERTREICALLAGVVRATLEEERGLPAPCRTREELHELLAVAPLAPLSPSAHAEFAALIDALLARADRAKFAAAPPCRSERATLFDLARRCLAALPEPAP